MSGIFYSGYPATAAAPKARATSWLPNPRRAYTPVLILIIWQGLVASGLVSPQTLPAPSAIATSAWQLAVSGQLLTNILVSLQRVAIGLAIGVSAGTALALVAGLSRLGEDAVDATVQMVRTLPHLALIPLMIMWFGIGETPKITLIALGSMFPIYLNLFAGIRGADRKLREAASTLGLS